MIRQLLHNIRCRLGNSCEYCQPTAKALIAQMKERGDKAEAETVAIRSRRRRRSIEENWVRSPRT